MIEARPRLLLLALLLAGCATQDPCLIRAQALAEGAPRLVTRAEAERWCVEDGR